MVQDNNGWLTRAARVVPGGMYGHQRSNIFGDNYPQFFTRAQGPYIFDSDGRRYIDLLCGYGPIVLGHLDEQVEAAAQQARDLGTLMNGPSPVMVELAERLVELVDSADWAMFTKTGTEATTTAITIARARTVKDKVIVAEGVYHGGSPWFAANMTGIPTSVQAEFLRFPYGDLDALELLLESNAGEVAAVMLTPINHNDRIDMYEYSVEQKRRVRDLCDKHGALLILDEVRTGMRLAIGDTWAGSGVQPDLSVWGKAISNGYPIAAVTGHDDLREAASQIFTAGTYWFEPVPMAAALKTLALLERGGRERQELAGENLRKIVLESIERNGIDAVYSGPAQMPYLRLEADSQTIGVATAGSPPAGLNRRMGELLIEQGVYIHPHHNWFVSAAHDDETVYSELAEAFDSVFVQLSRSN